MHVGGIRYQKRCDACQAACRDALPRQQLGAAHQREPELRGELHEADGKSTVNTQ